MFPVVLVRLAGGKKTVSEKPSKSLSCEVTHGGGLKTYEWESAVAAGGNLGLVGVDEDLGVSGRAAAAIADNDPLVRPLDGLLVDELHGRVGLWLRGSVWLACDPIRDASWHTRGGRGGMRCFRFPTWRL